MPYQNITQAKEGGFPTTAEGISLSLAQINKLAEIYDAIKEAGGVKNPMAVAWTTWKKTYKKEEDKWVKIEEEAKKNMEIYYRGEAFAFEGGARFKKDLIQIGTFLHPERADEKIKITKERMEKWIKNFHRYQANGGRIHIPLRHTDNPVKNTGWLEDMMIENDKLFGILEITDEDIAKKLEEASIKDVSISIAPNFLDEKGNKYDEVIEHVALTLIPQIRGQGPFIKLEEGDFETLQEEKMEESKDRLLVFYMENEGEEFADLSQSIKLVKEDWNRDKFSNKPWASVDATKLDKSAFLYAPDPEHRSTWKLPYRDESGKVNVGAVKAIYGVLQGAHGQGVDIPADALADIKGKIEGWRKELELGEVEEENMEKIKELETKIQELEDAKAKLEEDIKKGKDTNLESLKVELETREKEVKELQVFKVEQEKKEREAKVEELMKTGKLPPAQKDAVILLLEHYSGEVTTGKIEFESKKEDGTIEKKTIEATDLLLEVIGGLPKYVGFEELTVTDVKKAEMEAEETKKVGREIAEETTGTSVTAEMEKSKK